MIHPSTGQKESRAGSASLVSSDIRRETCSGRFCQLALFFRVRLPQEPDIAPLSISHSLSFPMMPETFIARPIVAAVRDVGSGKTGCLAGASALAGTDHVCRVCVWGSVFRFGRSVSGHMAGFYHLTLNIMGKSQKPAAQEAVILDVFNEVVHGMDVRKNLLGTGSYDPEKGLVLDLNLQIQRPKDNPDSKARSVQSVIERGEGIKPLWEYVGTAYENKNNPDNLTLFLHLRSQVKKDV
jgi:hypothetical protein